MLSGGVQDVDYTDVAPVGYIPVENTTFPSMDRLKEGVYTFKIHNWNFRNPTTGGFKAEIAFEGQIYRFIRREPLQHKEWITLAKIELKNGHFEIIEMMENDTTPIEIWGLKTNQFVPISAISYSPNYFDVFCKIAINLSVRSGELVPSALMGCAIRMTYAMQVPCRHGYVRH